MNYFIANDKMLAEGTLVAGPDTRGFRYGDGVFETIKMLNGKLHLADEHFARLWKGMMVLGFDIPKHFTPEKLTQQIKTLASKNNQDRAARIRLQVYRGDGGLYDAKNHFPQHIIQCWPMPEGHDAWNSNGLVLGVYSAVHKSCDVLSNLKHNNYLPYCMAALYAKKQKWNDALLLNSKGNICDSTIANLFIIKNGRVFTPALSEGCVAGVMRGEIIRQLKSTHFAVNETALCINDVLQADEVFLTNSINPFRWVKEIGASIYSTTLSSEMYKMLQLTGVNNYP